MFFGTPLFRTVLLPRLPLVALLAALALLAWILAHWTWVFLTPRQQGGIVASAPPPLSKVLAEQVVMAHLFGGGATGSEAVAATPQAAPSNIGVRGIYAGAGGHSGFAALVLDGNPVSAVVGQEFAPGMVLQRVYPDYVEILRGGQLEVVRMATAPLAPGAMNSPQTGVGVAGSSAQLQMVVRQLGSQQFGFSRKEMLAILKRPEQMVLLGRYAPHPRGGALLEKSPAGGLPEKLGLKVGDVVTAINGKLLSGPGDVAGLYDQLVKNGRVSVDVLRSGEKMNFGIQVAP
jgi:general secretion pathway protein C